jgi:hypothetical protein
MSACRGARPDHHRRDNRFLSLSTQNQGESGSITCSISVAGKVVDTVTPPASKRSLPATARAPAAEDPPSPVHIEGTANTEPRRIRLEPRGSAAAGGCTDARAVPVPPINTQPSLPRRGAEPAARRKPPDEGSAQRAQARSANRPGVWRATPHSANCCRSAISRFDETLVGVRPVADDTG